MCQLDEYIQGFRKIAGDQILTLHTIILGSSKLPQAPVRKFFDNFWRTQSYYSRYLSDDAVAKFEEAIPMLIPEPPRVSPEIRKPE